MRLRIDTSTVKFRVAGTAMPRKTSKNDPTQKTTGPRDPNGNRPIWSVRLLAVDTEIGSTEQIFVDVAGDMPLLQVDEIATVVNLTYAPWAATEMVNNQVRGKVMKAFRADSITMAAASSRHAA